MARAEDEFTAFVDENWAALYRSAYLLLGDHQLAEDLAQTALAKVFAAWPKVRDADHPPAYARAVLANTAASWFRRRGWRNEIAVDALPESPASLAEPPALDPLDVLDLLPRGQRAVLVLRYYEDLSVEQTAEALGLSTGTVKSQTARALAKLRAQLGAITPREGADRE